MLSNSNDSDIHNRIETQLTEKKPTYFGYNPKSIKHKSDFILEKNEIHTEKKLCISSIINLKIVITKREYIVLKDKENVEKIIVAPVVIKKGNITGGDYTEIFIQNADQVHIVNTSNEFYYERGKLILTGEHSGKIVLKGKVKKFIEYIDESSKEIENSNRKYKLLTKYIDVIAKINLNDNESEKNILMDARENNKLEIVVDDYKIQDEIRIENSID